MRPFPLFGGGAFVHELKEIVANSRFVQNFAAFCGHKGHENLTAGVPAREGKETICELYSDWC